MQPLCVQQQAEPLHMQPWTQKGLQRQCQLLLLRHRLTTMDCGLSRVPYLEVDLVLVGVDVGGVAGDLQAAGRAPHEGLYMSG
jgi:hypothetical protein